MTRKILIITGSTVLLILFSLWIYLLIFSAPGETGRWFMGGLTDPTPVSPMNEVDAASQLVIADTSLTQLTTRSVAGFGFISTASSSTTTADYYLRYAETGTGHVYEINLQTAVETRISGITIGKTVNAEFDPNGKAFVLTAEQDNTTVSSLYLFDGKPEQYKDLPTNSQHFHFTGDNRLRYTVVEGERTVAYELDWENLETNILWDVPLTQINISWTETGAILANKISTNLKSGIYEITNGVLTRIVSPLPSLTMLANKTGSLIWYSYYEAEAQQIVGVLKDRNSNKEELIALPVIPEKCFLSSDNSAVCAMSSLLLNSTRGDLNRWYRGEFTSDDRIWIGTEGGAAYEANLNELAGHIIDTTAITPTPDDSAFYFINKTDRTLWRYQFDQPLGTNDAYVPETPEQ